MAAVWPMRLMMCEVRGSRRVMYVDGSRAAMKPAMAESGSM